MLLECIRFILCAALLCDKKFNAVNGVFVGFKNSGTVPAESTLPFPTCHTTDIECQKRGLRTFFFMMDSGYMGMKPIDPIVLESIAVSFPDQQTSFLMRKVNVTGARWTKLVNRKFNLQGFKNGVLFKSDLHLSGLLLTSIATREEPLLTYITMDIQEVESNITYEWRNERGIDQEDYLLIGPERIAIRNSHVPTYFLQPDNEQSKIISEAIEMRSSILDHISNEIVSAVMHAIVDNFRLFASRTPVKYFYKYL